MTRLEGGLEPHASQVKVKLCLVGEAGCGKTLMIRPHVLNFFNDRYVSTIGTNVSKKLLNVPNPLDGEIALNMVVWDIRGERGFRGRLQEDYFRGAKGIIAVCDATRKSTLVELHGWIESVYSVAGRIPVVLAIEGLGPPVPDKITEPDARRFSDMYGAPYVFTSTGGESVETVFGLLARQIVEDKSRAKRKRPPS